MSVEVKTPSEKSTQYTLAYLVAVLKLSRQWGCTSGEDFALRRLMAIEPSVPSALRLRLARVYQIENWLKPALRRIVFAPLKMLSDDDLAWLGYETYVFIARVKEEYDSLRRRLAFTAPPIPWSPRNGCTSHDVCLKVWREIWIRRIGERLLHPIEMCALGLGWELKDAIEELDVSGMTPACGNLAKSSAAASPGLKADDALIQEAARILDSTVPVDKSYFKLEY